MQNQLRTRNWIGLVIHVLRPRTVEHVHAGGTSTHRLQGSPGRSATARTLPKKHCRSGDTGRFWKGTVFVVRSTWMMAGRLGEQLGLGADDDTGHLHDDSGDRITCGGQPAPVPAAPDDPIEPQVTIAARWTHLLSVGVCRIPATLPNLLRLSAHCR